ncbi:MAG: hypothetical protein ACOH2N_15000 [Devosia sp.]
MIAITATQSIDYAERYAATLARLRMAETANALDHAINAVDAVCSVIIETMPRTRAEFELRHRAVEWVRLRPGFVVSAHKSLTSRQLYRKRRVQDDRPYQRKPRKLDRIIS